jgi:tripartite-type tricarboxylate transporter receptor subunit TctC
MLKNVSIQGEDMKGKWKHLAAAAASVIACAAVHANDYPNRPITLMHGFGAGGNADVVARIVASKMQDGLKTPVVVESKTGAGGTIASAAVAKAQPDGYTLIMLTGGHAVSAAYQKSLPYQPVKDFQMISLVSTFPFVIAVRADHPAKTLADLITMARREPGKLTFSSVGIGSTQHLVGELLGSTSGTKLMHIPYRGGAAPVQAVLSGDVDMLVDSVTVATGHVKSGKLRALAVTSATPWPALPGVPPVADTLKGFEVRSWLGIAAPKGTPADVVEKLNKEIGRAVVLPDARRALEGVGSEPAPSTPAKMETLVDSEIRRWKQVITDAGITPE